jgi:hypothetical protein
LDGAVVGLQDHALSWFPGALRYNPDAVQADVFSECQFGDERLLRASDLQSHASTGAFLDPLRVNGHPAMLLSVKERARKMNRDFMPDMISERYKGESIPQNWPFAHLVKGAMPGEAWRIGASFFRNRMELSTLLRLIRSLCTQSGRFGRTKKTSQSPTPLQNIGRELAGLRGSDGGAVGAKSVHQGYQVGAILIGYGRKFQAQAAVGKLMLHDSFGTNLSLGN